MKTEEQMLLERELAKAVAKLALAQRHDLFAAMAMHAIAMSYAHPDCQACPGDYAEKIAKEAFIIADAMVAESAKPNK